MGMMMPTRHLMPRVATRHLKPMMKRCERAFGESSRRTFKSSYFGEKVKVVSTGALCPDVLFLVACAILSIYSKEFKVLQRPLCSCGTCIWVVSSHFRPGAAEK